MNPVVLPFLQAQITQAEFAQLIGVSEAKVSQLAADGTLERGASAQAWLHAYCARLREQAAGRAGDGAGGLDLVQERAALAREQRVSYEIKNAIARGEYAPIGLLADVLAFASRAVVDRFDALPGRLKKACPDLPSEARDVVATVITSARNEWIRATAELVVKQVDLLADEDDGEPVDLDEEGEAA